MADAMYAPVVTRFLTYDVKLDRDLPALLQPRSWRCRRCSEWIAAAKLEPDDIDELDMDF